jgi:hypothetical protein
MAIVLDLTEAWCCRAFRQYSHLIRGAVYGCLGRVQSSWGKVPVEELLLEGMRGMMLGAVQSVFGEEEEQTCQQEMGEDRGIMMESWDQEVTEVMGVVVEREEVLGEMLGQEEGEMGLDILFQEEGEMMGEMMEGGVEQVMQVEVHQDEGAHDMEGEGASYAEVASQRVSSRSLSNILCMEIAYVQNLYKKCFCSEFKVQKSKFLP